MRMLSLRLTPLGTGILPPTRPMSNGHPPSGGVPDGNVIVDVNEMELEVPPLTPPAVTVSALLENDPLTCGGFGGKVPVS